MNKRRKTLRIRQGRYFWTTVIFLITAVSGALIIVSGSNNLISRYREIRYVGESDEDSSTLDAGYQKLFKNMMDLRQATNEYYAVLDTSTTFQTIIDEVLRLASDNNLESRKTEQGDLESTEDFLQTSINIQLSGRYKDLCRFVEELELGPYPVWFSSIEVKTADATSTEIVCDLNGFIAGLSDGW